MDEFVLRVARSGLIARNVVAQGDRGVLGVVEGRTVPFAIQRVYTISGIREPDASRGHHAHRKTDQVLFVIQGSLTLTLDDGANSQEITITDEHAGIRLGPMLWHSMSKFSADCVVMVVASLPYDESDYIRDYDEFKRAIQ